MAKLTLKSVLKQLNTLVKKHKSALILGLVTIVAISLASNLFTSPTAKRKPKQKEGFGGQKEIIFFTMETCPHCQKFDPEWEKFAKTTNMKNQKISAKSGHELINKMGVSGYPTVIIMHGNEKVDTFKGPRTEDGLQQFASKHQN